MAEKISSAAAFRLTVGSSVSGSPELDTDGERAAVLRRDLALAPSRGRALRAPRPPLRGLQSEGARAAARGQLYPAYRRRSVAGVTLGIVVSRTTWLAEGVGSVSCGSAPRAGVRTPTGTASAAPAAPRWRHRRSSGASW